MAEMPILTGDFIMDRDIPKQFEVYKHFKGKRYLILAVGHHSEIGEKLVIYYDMSQE